MLDPAVGQAPPAQLERQTALMARSGVDVGRFAEVSAHWAAEAKTPLYVAVDGRLATTSVAERMINGVRVRGCR